VAIRSAGTAARSRTAVITPLIATWCPTTVTLAIRVALRPGPVLPRSPGPVTGGASRRGPRSAAEFTRGRGPARATELTAGRGPPAAIPNIVIGGGTRGAPPRVCPAVRRTCSRRAGGRRTWRPACTVTIATTARGRAAARLVTRRRATRAATSSTRSSTTGGGLTRSTGLARTPPGRLPATRTATARCPTIRHAYQPPAFTIPRQAKRAAQPDWERPSSNMSGGVLLSHAVPRAVPSALKGLTSGFGMGPGVSPSL
jgi:hypothetical protein